MKLDEKNIFSIDFSDLILDLLIGLFGGVGFLVLFSSSIYPQKLILILSFLETEVISMILILKDVKIIKKQEVKNGK